MDHLLNLKVPIYLQVPLDKSYQFLTHGEFFQLPMDPRVQRPVPPLGEHGAATLASSVAVDPEMMAKQKAARQVRQDTSAWAHDESRMVYLIYY